VGFNQHVGREGEWPPAVAGGYLGVGSRLNQGRPVRYIDAPTPTHFGYGAGTFPQDTGHGRIAAKRIDNVRNGMHSPFDNIQRVSVSNIIRVRKRGKVRRMNTKADRLRHARKDAGFKSTSAAAERLGVKGSTYRAHENGQNDYDSEHAELYGRVFGVSPEYLLFGRSDKLQEKKTLPSNPPNALIGERLPSLGGAKIPLYGQAVGGVDGEFVLNGNRLDEILAPPSLSGTTGAYAVTVAGDSMSPRYEDGETVYVDPTRRVVRGDYVVAQIHIDESSAPLAYIKRFVRHNAQELVLEQFNPPKELRFPHDSVSSVHFVVMAGRL
jgi:phage repressor protein C with HTH and peptisase S24 domain